MNQSSSVTSVFYPVRSIILIALGAGLASQGALATTNETLSNNDPILLEKITVSGRRDQLKVYEQKTDELFDKTRQLRTISYRDVILTTYDPARIDLLGVLLQKKRYRETVARGHTFLCNYAAINKPVRVIYSLDDPLLRYAGGVGFSFASGTEFVFKRQLIRIDLGGNNIKVAHAAGASLCASPSPEGLEKVKQLGQQKKDSEFVQEVNFEVRLQDMNRFFAFITGRPIMNSLDALQALVLLGEKPDANLVRSIFARNNLAFAESDVAHVYATTQQGHNGQFGSEGLNSTGGEYAYFTLARRLVVGLEVMERLTSGEIGSNAVPVTTENMYSEYATTLEQGLQTLGGKDYEEYLERILIEAPGHI